MDVRALLNHFGETTINEMRSELGFPPVSHGDVAYVDYWLAINTHPFETRITSLPMSKIGGLSYEMNKKETSTSINITH